MLLPITLPDSSKALLLLAGPGASPLQVVCRVQADQVQGLTVRQERRPLAPGFTVEMKWQSLLPRAGARALRAGLLGLGRTAPGGAGTAAPLQTILCPFWPAVVPASDVGGGHFDAAYWAVWEPDGTRAALYAAEDGIPEAYDDTVESLTAPVLFGHFTDWPDPDALTDDVATGGLGWIETGAYENGLVTIHSGEGSALPVGPTLHGQTWPVLPCAARIRDAKAGGVAVLVARRKIGFGRGEAETHHPQIPARKLELGHDLTEAEALRVLLQWFTSEGTVKPFWVPSATSPCRLTASAGAGATTITVDNAAALLGHAHVWLGSATGSTAARRITGIAGNVLTLDAALGVAVAPGDTSVQPLLFARFSRPDLALTVVGDVWSAKCELLELPAEYGLAEGEEHGVNIGPLTGLAWCYAITDGTETWRYTSYAEALTLGGHSFAPINIGHGEMKERLNLDASECTVTLRDWPGSP
ncbi:MAG: hypothetical protein H7067_14080, partial [Burkholderiales bacterium]|nr:hypothetical protein [Opitutaceae bacterium]